MAFSMIPPLSTERMILIFSRKRAVICKQFKDSKEIVLIIFSWPGYLFKVCFKLRCLDYCPHAASQSLEICSMVVGSPSPLSEDFIAFTVMAFGVSTKNGNFFWAIIWCRNNLIPSLKVNPIDRKIFEASFLTSGSITRTYYCIRFRHNHTSLSFIL